jgi:hypothetical protein
MLVASGDLEVGETAGFELVGPGFRFAGLATVAHRTNRAIDLRFLSWEGPAYRSVCALIAARLRRQRRLVVFTGTERPRRAHARGAGRGDPAELRSSGKSPSRGALNHDLGPRWPGPTGESRWSRVAREGLA